MGKPPPHIVFKKLATLIVKRTIPTGLYDLQEAKNKELVYEKLKGPESIEYKIWSERVRELSAIEPKYKNMVDSRNYHIKVLQHIAPPARKVTLKGRHRYSYHNTNAPNFKLFNIDIDD